MQTLRWINLVTTSMFLLFTSLVIAKSSVTIITVWWILAVPLLVLVLNLFLRKKDHIGWIIVWGLMWAILWISGAGIGAVLTMSIPYLDIPYIAEDLDPRIFISVILIAGIINFLSIFILPFREKLKAFAIKKLRSP